MKKLLSNKTKFKFIISSIIMLAVLALLCGYIYATATNEEDSTGRSENAPGSGRYYTLDDLKDLYEILCCYHGGSDGHLRSTSVLEAGGSSTSTTDSGKEIGKLTMSDKGATALTITSTSSSSPYSENSYTVDSLNYYTVSSTEIATPKEAYILAEMIEETVDGSIFYDDGYSAIQYAWWTTAAGSHGSTTPATTSLQLESEEFEAYIKQVAVSTSTSTYTEQSYEFTDDSGTVHSGTVEAPVIEYEPSYNEDANQDGEINDYDEVTVSWDTNTQTWTVGPFSINYVEASYDADDREAVVFAGITNATLYTNLGEVSSDNWKFNWISGKRSTDDTYEFPHKNEVFYIEIDYVEGMTEVTNLHFDFKYMNAGGSFDYLEGVYFTETWTPQSKVIETCSGPTGNETTCSHGYTTSHDVKWQYWLKLTGMQEKTGQLLAYGIIGARWYETTSLDMEAEPDIPKTVTVKIVKEIVDEDGNKITSGYDTTEKFKFRVYKDGKLYNTVYVKGNSSVSFTYKWDSDEDAPTFSVEEVLPNDSGFKQYGNIVVNGEVVDGGLIKFTAKNTPDEDYGYVSIKKKVIGDSSNSDTFYFKLYVDSELYVDTEGGTTDSNGVITVKAGEKWTSSKITWTGSNPSYKVKEINIPDGYTLVNIENDSGKLLGDGKTVNVVAKNKGTSYESGTLKIKKITTEDTDEYFYFKVTVDGKTTQIKLKAGSTWSQTYYWEEGEDAPSYSVSEINIPDGWELQEITNSSGTLEADSTVTVTATNTPIEESTTIYVTKTAVGTGDVDVSNVPFEITTTITGEFTIDGEEVDGSKTITTTVYAGETVAIGTVSWAGDSPYYEVTETNIPDNWTLVDIANNKGYLSDLNGDGVINVKCTNSYDIGDEPNSVDIQIVKEIVDSEGNKVTSGFDTTKEFQFIVYKDGVEYTRVYVKGNSTSDTITFTWEANESAPTITVVEDEDSLPDGFVKYGDIVVDGEVKNGGTVTFTQKNQIEEKSGYISITKKVVGEGLEGKSFSFKLTVDGETYTDSSTADDGTITVAAGETWTSQKITWTGDAPSYSVTEINLPDGAKLIGMTNASGTLAEGTEPIAVIATNGPDTTYEQATLTVKKVLDDNISSDTKFKITIVVGDESFEKELSAGQSWTETFTWETGTEAPTYEVTETDMPDGWELVSIDPSSGTLSADSNITVTVTNKGEKHTGAVSVTKETITDDKEGVDTGESTATFDFVIAISGTFETADGESYVNGTKKYTTTLSKGQTYTTPTITWYGDEAPSYTVTEDTTTMPDGWKQVNITNSSGYLEDGTTIESVCTNYYEIKVVYDLTMEMSGIVWEDAPLNEEDKNTEDSVANGQYDAGYESGIQNIEVYIWRCVYDASGNELTQYRRLATGYSEDGDYEIEFPIYTDSNGIWEAPRMSVPGLSDEEKNAGATKADYYVEFVYDGQTYEPTDFLVTGTVSEFKSASNSEKSAYLYDSMAVENEAEREDFDESFAVITGNQNGDSAINDDGETNGTAIGTDGGTKDLLYYSTDSTETVDGNTRKISELQTTDSEGYVYDQYKISATTKEGGLTYPFDDKVHLESMKKTLNKIENCLVITYTYSATYPYMLNINLGLVKRDEAELAVTKDVYSAAVVVNEKLVNYQYNEYVDFESEEYADYLNLQLKAADANISYKLDLYESDYYYRAKVYEGTAAGDALTDYYTSIGQSIDEMDLDVYLTYKVSVYNNSDSYLASIGTLVDYFDEDLELVEATQYKYLQEANGQAVDSTLAVAEPTYAVKNKDTDNIINVSASADYGTVYYSSDVDSETSNSGSMTVSDNVQEETSKNYYRAEIDLSNCGTIAVGERIDVYLTFKVRTDETPASFGDSADSAAASYVRLGTKANIAEIGSYTTYYTDGSIAGKVDKDSAPDNVDIENKNTKDWYEDDSDSAPIITLDLYTESRNVSGLAWEDEETETIDYDEVIGNGIYDEGEELIGNLTTAIVEKVRVKNTGTETYTEYDFVWPTDTSYDFLNNNTLYDITGYDSITLTSNSAEDKGTYIFENIPAGNYVVRFYYGQYASNSLDDEGNLVPIDYTTEAETGYDTPAVYDGQDYKTTTYQADNTNDDGTSDYVDSSTGYILDSEWYDFSTCEYDEDGNIVTHNSDAIDNEARRLEVIAYSQTLDNTITNVLATANDADADHTELYNNTYMFADTAKINLNIENMTSLEGQRITVTNATTGTSEEVYVATTVDELLSVYGKSDVNGDKGTVNKINYTYNIEAVDVGLEARSETVLTLDKEISSISLTTNSGDTILKAVYDISYEFTIDADTGTSTYEAIVELNEDKSYGTSNLIAINKDEEERVQNFRYIYYDDSIAEGLNLEIVYQFTALNLSEVDRTGELANMTTDEILTKANELKDQTYEIKNGILVKQNHPYIGEYVGSIYYLGQRDAYTQDDAIVETTVRQLIDYVDNDAVFTASDNTSLNSSWKSTTAQELLDGNVIDQDITEEVDGVVNIVDDKGVVYTTEERNNLILSLDTAEGDDYANPSLVIATYPYAGSVENTDNTDITVSCVASMNLTITRTIDSEIDDDDLSYDNVAEIVKFTNTVGRRDILTIAGNLDPKGSSTGDGEFAAALEERDSSATELITFTPPTGLGTDTTLMIQILIVALVALVILVGGVIGIKKFVIKRD